MNEIMVKSVEQVPALVVMAMMVGLFLKHLRSYNILLRDMGKEANEARGLSREVIDKNTAAVSRNTEVMHTLVGSFQEWKIAATHCAVTAATMKDVSNTLTQFDLVPKKKRNE